MKNKFLLALLAIVCVVCCLFALVACDNKPNDIVEVESVTLNMSSASMKVGDKLTLRATVTPDNAPNITVNWSSDVPGVAEVNQDGVVTAVKEGQTTVTASAGGKYASCVISVDQGDSEQSDKDKDPHKVTASQWKEIITDMGVIGVNSNVTVRAEMNGVDYYVYCIANGRSKFLEAGEDELSAKYIEWNQSSYDSVAKTYQCNVYTHTDRSGWVYRAKELPIYVDWDLMLFALPHCEFGKFEYVAEDEAYYCKGPIVINLQEGLACIVEDIHIAFGEGKLRSLVGHATMEINGEREVIGDVSFIFENYYYTTVTLPQGAIEVIDSPECPIEEGARIEVEKGTSVAEFYEAYPELETETGIWWLQMYNGNSWIDLPYEATLPRGEFTCRLVYMGKEETSTVNFTLVGISSNPVRTVDEEQWSMALWNVYNYVLEIKLGGKVVTTLQQDGSSSVHVISADEEFFVGYDDGYVRFDKDGSSWIKNDIIYESYRDATDVSDRMDSILRRFSEIFDEFTYSNGVYAADEVQIQYYDDMMDVQLAVQNVKLAFDDGDLIDVQVEVDGETYIISNIHRTNVSLPTNFTKGNGLMRFVLNEDKQSYTFANNGTVLDTEVVIPSQYKGLPVTAVASYAFGHATSYQNTAKVTSIVIPDSVTSIALGALSGCGSLQSLTIPFVGASADVSAYDGEKTLFGYIFGKYYYDGGEEITQFYGSSEYEGSRHFYLPTTLTSVTVTGGKLYYGAFYGCQKLTDVTLGNSITSIGDRAFCGCNALTSITFHGDVTSIGEWAFYNCAKLENIVIPDSVCAVGQKAFDNTKWLQNQPAGIVYVGKVAYTYKGSITAPVVIKDGTLGIAGYAFYQIRGLTDITLPDSLTNIGSHAFAETYINSIDIPNVTSVGEYAFAGTNVQNVTIPSSMTSIPKGLFYGCSHLTSVTLPDNLTSIGAYAFYYTSIQNINFPEGLTFVGEAAFGNTQWIDNQADGVVYVGNVAYGFKGDEIDTSVVIKDGTTAIAPRAFASCQYIVSITIPDSVTAIGENAFAGCSALASITIPNGVTTIEKYTFAGCGSLASVTLPSSLTSIEQYAFASCTSLTSIDIPNSVTTIGNRAFHNTGLTSIILPNGLKTIEQETFLNCVDLASVTIPDGVTVIDDWAFQGCTSLASIVIPDSVKTIEYYSFADCTALTSITVGRGVRSTNSLFYGCPVETAIISGSSMSQIPYNELKTLVIVDYFPDYELSYLKYFAKLESITVAADDENYTSQGGVLYNKDKTEVVYIPMCIKGEVIIADGVTTVGDILGRSAMTSLVLPSSVTEIGDIANCENLLTVTLPEGLDASHVTFNNCPKYKGSLVGGFYVKGTTLMGVENGGMLVIVPSTVTAIGANAFAGIDGLKYVYVPDTVNSYDNDAFAGCENVAVFFKSSNVPGNGVTLYTYYYNVENITDDGWIYRVRSNEVEILFYVGVGGEVTVPAQIDGKEVARIKEHVTGGNVHSAFLKRTDITKITILSTSMEIVDNALDHMTNLTTIELAESVAMLTIRSTMFSTCSSVTSITLAGGNDRYMLYTLNTNTQMPAVVEFTDGEDLYAKVMATNGNYVVCVIMIKQQSPTE